jgi:hypothetical protein
MIKNIIIILVIIAFGGAGYYVFTERDSLRLYFDETALRDQALLAETQLFIERGAVLRSLSMDTAVLNDPRFTSLRSYTQPVPERPIGRPNPFSPVEAPPARPLLPQF